MVSVLVDMVDFIFLMFLSKATGESGISFARFGPVFSKNLLTLKRLGKVNLTHYCGFSKNVLFRERVKPCFFVTFNIIISHIFHENFIEIPQVVKKI